MKREGGLDKNYLGLVADHRRAIKDGREYDKYFPEASLATRLLDDDGAVKDTVQYMGDFISRFSSDTKELAPLLKGETLEETCRKIWTWCYTYLQYKLDKDGTEQLRRPRRSWYDGQILSRDPNTEPQSGIDCDCFSIFVGTLLHNLGIKNFRLRITKYGAGWQHVYVIVPKANSFVSVELDPLKKKTNRNNYYTIDCVLNKFDYEKEFTDKMDYNMEKHHLSGIPIELLSGLGNNYDSQLDHVLSGADFQPVMQLAGAGEPTQKNFEDAMYNYLISTRNYIQKNPMSVITAGGAKNNLEMLNYAIKHWNTPQRDKALDILEREESKLADLGLGNSDDEGAYDQINSVGQVLGKVKFFAKVKEAVKKAGQNVKEAVKNVAQNVVKYNPLSLAVRGGFLLGMKINIGGMAAKLYPAFSTAPVKQGREQEHNAAKAAWAKVKNLFVNTLKGDEEKLKEAIKDGSGKKAFLGSADGLGDPSTITALTAASVPIIKAGDILDESGVTSEDKVKFGTKILNFFKKVGGGIKKLFKRKNKEGKEVDVYIDENGNEVPYVSGDDDSPVVDDQLPDKGGDSDQEKESDGSDTNKPEDEDKGFFAKARDFAKENPGTTTVIALTTAAGISLLFPGVRRAVGLQKSKGVGAVKVYRGKHKVKRRKGFLAKGTKVKAITIK